MLLKEAKQILKNNNYKIYKEMDPLENEEFIAKVSDYISKEGFSPEACKWAVDNMSICFSKSKILNKHDPEEVAIYMIMILDSMTDEELEEEGIGIKYES